MEGMEEKRAQLREFFSARLSDSDERVVANARQMLEAIESPEFDDKDYKILNCGVKFLKGEIRDQQFIEELRSLGIDLVPAIWRQAFGREFRGW